MQSIVQPPTDSSDSEDGHEDSVPLGNDGDQATKTFDLVEAAIDRFDIVVTDHPADEKFGNFHNQNVP